MIPAARNTTSGSPGAHFEQQRLEHTAAHQGAANTEGDSGADHGGRTRDHQPEQPRAIGAEGGAHGQLASALRHREGQHTIDADTGEQ